MGVWKRIKSWTPKPKERVGKVGVWRRLDFGSLKRTEETKSKRRWEEAKVEGRGRGERKEGSWDESGKEEWRDKKVKWECGMRGTRRG